MNIRRLRRIRYREAFDYNDIKFGGQMLTTEKTINFTHLLNLINVPF
jgi:hypothetical protein